MRDHVREIIRLGRDGIRPLRLVALPVPAQVDGHNPGLPGKVLGLWGEERAIARHTGNEQGWRYCQTGIRKRRLSSGSCGWPSPKSVRIRVVEEAPGFLALRRDLHLHPVRAGIMQERRAAERVIPSRARIDHRIKARARWSVGADLFPAGFPKTFFPVDSHLRCSIVNLPSRLPP